MARSFFHHTFFSLQCTAHVDIPLFSSWMDYYLPFIQFVTCMVATPSSLSLSLSILAIDWWCFIFSFDCVVEFNIGLVTCHVLTKSICVVV